MIEGEYDKSIRPILDAFDKIREVLRFEKIELPKIVVVGDQSAGKSSVLESITGISLPRGENTVTKCPIVIQIRGVEDTEEESAKVRIEGEKPENEIQIPLAELHAKIHEKQNEILAKTKSEIAEIPLYVTVKKRNAPDLTLYDLPGITYKSDSLTTSIRNIIAKYSAEKQTLVLLVLAANTDLTTSEAISLIRKNEDFKDRTLAIITKIDLVVNQDKKLFSKIMKNELDLRYNPIVVRNRTQDELESNESSESVKHKEEYLIDSNDQLRMLPKESKGTQQLVYRLIQLQKEKLLNSKIEIKAKIIERISLLREELAKMPLPAETATEKIDRLKECVYKLSHNYNNLIKGNYIDIEDETQVFPNLTKIFREKFAKFFAFFELKKEVFFSADFQKKVLKVIEETRGFKLENFADQDSFHQLMKKEISSVEPKTESLLLECSEDAKEALLMLVNYCFNDFPKLKKAVSFEINELVKHNLTSAKSLIDQLLYSEKEGEWTVNPYYMDIYNKIFAKLKDFKKQYQENKANFEANWKANPQECLEINDCKIAKNIFMSSNVLYSNSNSDQDLIVFTIQVSCFAYWKVFQKRFTDYACLIILSKLIYHFRDEMAKYIEKKFSPTDDDESENNQYLMEDTSILLKRKDIRQSLENLEQALIHLQKIM